MMLCNGPFLGCAIAITFSTTPGRKGSMNTSAFEAMALRVDSPSFDFRSIAIERFPRDTGSAWLVVTEKKHNSTDFEETQFNGECNLTILPFDTLDTVITLAPKSAKIHAASGPGPMPSSSNTVIPCSAMFPQKANRILFCFCFWKFYIGIPIP